jgi:hypothetical protein
MIDVRDLRKVYGGRTVLHLPRWQVAAGESGVLGAAAGLALAHLVIALVARRLPAAPPPMICNRRGPGHLHRGPEQTAAVQRQAPFLGRHRHRLCRRW